RATTTDLLDATTVERDGLLLRVAELTEANDRMTAQIAELTASAERAAEQLRMARIDHREALRLLKGHLEKAVADIEIRLADKLSAADRAALEKEQTDLNASLIVVGEQLKTLDELIGE
ncbi:MAG: hypothetical protein Q4E72_07580, partial [bacterium]|nr:hypothetical protein [bacterium]